MKSLRAKSKRACTEKVVHASEHEAQKEVCRMFETRHIRLVAYFCERHQGWHTGHTSPKIKKVEAAWQQQR